jgi:hydrogenase expression/formation protein HypC
MCLAVPVRVNSLLPDQMAQITLDGVSMTISTALVDDVKVGDYVVLHVGYALARIDPVEAERTLDLMREAGIIPPQATEEAGHEIY